MLVSAVVPTYNRAHMIGKAIESILGQSYPNLELIVVDDGSTDNTEEIVRTYANGSATPITYFKKTNGGCASARNRGVELASGECIAFLDSDDQWLPNAIDSMMKVLHASEADFVYSPSIEVFGNGHEFVAYPAAAENPADFPREHFLTNQARACSILYRRIIFNELKIDECLLYNEDSDFLQRVALNYKAAYSPLPAARVFHHDDNKSGNRIGIYRALLRSSERMLRDFPEFAESLAEAAARRIVEIKALLVEELLLHDEVDEALAVAAGIMDQLRTALRLSLKLHAPILTKISHTITAIMKKIEVHMTQRRKSGRLMKTMHVFGTYLPMTENWGYRLIRNLPETQLYIVAEKSDNLDAFALPQGLFLLKPVVEWQLPPHPLVDAAVKLVRLLLKRVWVRLVVYFAGKSSVIHAHFSYMGWHYLWLAEMKKIPLVVSYYGYDYEYLPNLEPVWRERYREMFRRAALFIAEGNAGRNKLIAMGCPEDKVKVVHLGVETSNVPFYRRTKKPGELKLVQIATFTGKKGYDVTVESFIRAAGNCPGLTLTLVGKDPEGMRGGLQQTIRESGLEGQVEFVDGIDFARLHSFLKQFHVFIHPSKYGFKGDSEGGAPVVILDAQATGMPVLSTLHCDIPDEVIHGVTGLLVEENDSAGLAGAIETFYAMDDASYRVYCEQARRHVEEHFDAVRCAQELRKAYDGLTGKPLDHETS